MQLHANHEETLREAIARIGEAWAGAVPFPCRFDLESLGFHERDSFFRSLGNSTCAGRSSFLAEGLGHGGWILGETAADRLARGVLNLPPPPPFGTTTYGGPIEDGIQVLHALFLDAWNHTVPTELRLDDDSDGRSTERLRGLGTRPVRDPAYPVVLTVDIEIAGQKCPLGVFLCPTLIETPDATYAPPLTLTSWAGGERAPIAFEDPSGAIIDWVMGEIRAGRLVAKRRSGAVASRATLTVGGDDGQPPSETLVLEPRE